MIEIICLNVIIRFHCYQPAKSCSTSHTGICKLKETSTNWFPTSSTRPRASDFMLKQIQFVVDNGLGLAGFLGGLVWFFFPGEGRGLKKERGETGEKAAAKAGLTTQA